MPRYKPRRRRNNATSDRVHQRLATLLRERNVARAFAEQGRDFGLDAGDLLIEEGQLPWETRAYYAAKVGIPEDEVA